MSNQLISTMNCELLSFYLHLTALPCKIKNLKINTLSTLNNSNKVEVVNELSGCYSQNSLEKTFNSVKGVSELVQKLNSNLSFVQAIIAFSFLLIIIFLVIVIVRLTRQKNAYKHKLYMARQQALCKQMSPHFIFNALNSIQSLIYKNKIEISITYITRLAELMRKVLYKYQNNLVSLKEELEVLKVYCDLERLRFENDFVFNIIIDKDINTTTIRIPPFLLQPFLENAIKHGLEPISKKGEINLKIENSAEGIKCTIEDNGIGIDYKKKHKNGHISMASSLTARRLNMLSLYYKKHFHLKLENLKSNSGAVLGTITEITIPILTYTSK